MDTQFFFPSPVEVVKVTKNNLEEVAAWCGGRVAQTESRQVKGRIDKYVWVPTPKGSTTSWAFPGMYITKRAVVTLKDELKTTYAVFRRSYFEKNYFETPDEAIDATWARGSKKNHPSNHKRPEVVVGIAGEEELKKFKKDIEKVKEAVRDIAKAAGLELDDKTELAIGAVAEHMDFDTNKVTVTPAVDYDVDMVRNGPEILEHKTIEVDPQPSLGKMCYELNEAGKFDVNELTAMSGEDVKANYEMLMEEQAKVSSAPLSDEENREMDELQKDVEEGYITG